MHTQHNSILRSVPTAPRNLSLPPSYRMCISCSPVPLRRLCQASLEEEVRDTRCRLHWAILSFPSKRGSSTTQINPQNRWPAGAPKRELAARVRHWRARVTDAVSMADRNQVALQSCCRRGDLLVLAGPRPEKPQMSPTNAFAGADLLVETTDFRMATSACASDSQHSGKVAEANEPTHTRQCPFSLHPEPVVRGPWARWHAGSPSREMERRRRLRSGRWNGDRGLNCEVEPGSFLGRMRYRFSAVPAPEGVFVGEAMVLWLEVRLVTGVVRAWNA